MYFAEITSILSLQVYSNIHSYFVDYMLKMAARVIVFSLNIL